MIMIVSTAVLITLVCVMLYAEKTCAHRHQEFFQESDKKISELAESVVQKYHARYGRDPTGKINTLVQRPNKK